MLKGIPKCISPELLYVLDKMGHGDEIVISDGNFPGESVGKDNIVIRSDGTGVPELLVAILQLMPLDTDADCVFLMDKTESDRDLEIPIWDEYRRILKEHTAQDVHFIERQAFYDRAKKAYAVVVTGEGAIYANVLLKKGVVKQ